MTRRETLTARVAADPRYPNWLLLTCLVGLFSTGYTTTILAVSVKAVAEDLRTTPGVVSWVMTAPMLASAVAIPILGRVGDLKGHRKVYLVGLTISIVANALSAASPNAAWLIGLRTIAQVAGSGTVPAVFAILFRTFPPERRLAAASWASAVMSGSSVAGLVIGGPIVDHLGWQPIFLMQAAIASTALVPAIVILQRDNERKDVSVDLPGAMLLATAVFGLTFGVNRLTADGPSPLVVSTLLLCPIAGAALVAVEKRAETPILPIALTRNAVMRRVAAASSCTGAGWTGTFVMTPLLLQTVFGFDATATSLLTLARTFSITLAAPVSSRLGRRFGERPVLQVAMLGVAASYGVSALGAASSTLAVVVAALVIAGWSFGHVQPSMLTLIANSVPEEDLGLASSLQQMSNSIGTVVGIGLLSAIAADTENPHTFAAAFAVSMAFGVVGFLAVLTRGRAARSPAAELMLR